MFDHIDSLKVEVTILEITEWYKVKTYATTKKILSKIKEKLLFVFKDL